MRRSAILALLASVGTSVAAAAQPIEYAYTQFDADKTCRHRAGRDEEGYGTWTCAGTDNIAVWLSAGDQRMQVSFGSRAAQELAAKQTFPSFNSVYSGTIEWRMQRGADGKLQPFATILRWNVKLPDDERASTGRVLVVTRLGPGGVCHVGYVDARANPSANDLARQLADEKARDFKCDKDKPEWRGTRSPGL
jgi:hypothetical protein